MPYNPRRSLLRMLPVLLLAVPACAPKERIQPLFPPAADLRDVTEAKPVAPVEIVTDAQAAARYDVEVETWGERVSRAGGRICRWAVANGAALPFACPVSPAVRDAQEAR